MTSKYDGLSWKIAPKHPALLYTETNGYIILKYFRTYITTTWESVEYAILVKNKSRGKVHKPNTAAVNRTIKRMVGEPATHNKIGGAKLFIRLVDEGLIHRSPEAC